MSDRFYETQAQAEARRFATRRSDHTRWRANIDREIASMRRLGVDAAVGFLLDGYPHAALEVMLELLDEQCELAKIPLHAPVEVLPGGAS